MFSTAIQRHKYYLNKTLFDTGYTSKIILQNCVIRLPN